MVHFLRCAAKYQRRSDTIASILYSRIFMFYTRSDTHSLGKILGKDEAQLGDVLFFLVVRLRHYRVLHRPLFRTQNVSVNCCSGEAFEYSRGNLARGLGVRLEGLEDFAHGDSLRMRAPGIVVR